MVRYSWKALDPSRLILLGALAFAAFASPVMANERPSFLILGVIASQDEGRGVALLKNLDSQRTFAVRQGARIASGLRLSRISRNFVFLRRGRELVRLKVGERTRPQRAARPSRSLAAAGAGLERRGDIVRVAADYRDYIVKENLGRVLMQAAAIPYYDSGKLVGFRLRQIDPGSVYERAGFSDGDVVTAINGQPLSEVGTAVRVLKSLKTKPRARVSFLRNGRRRTLEIVVQ